jgi:glycerol-3-phosphate acyltransferase PlsY
LNTYIGLPPIHIFHILFPAVSYLVGSIPFGKLISRRVANIDITQKGSGNIGATNVARELGLKWGILTLILDVLKGFIPTFLFDLFFPHFEIGLCAVGLFAVIGHQFSLYQRFRGGKGVATALGIYLAIAPIPCIMALALFVLTVYISNYVSLGSLISISTMPLFIIFHGKSATITITSLITAFLICLKHKENIRRLAKGEERGFRKRMS